MSIFKKLFLVIVCGLIFPVGSADFNLEDAGLSSDEDQALDQELAALAVPSSDSGLMTGSGSGSSSLSLIGGRGIGGSVSAFPRSPAGFATARYSTGSAPAPVFRAQLPSRSPFSVGSPTGIISPAGRATPSESGNGRLSRLAGFFNANKKPDDLDSYLQRLEARTQKCLMSDEYSAFLSSQVAFYKSLHRKLGADYVNTAFITGLIVDGKTEMIFQMINQINNQEFALIKRIASRADDIIKGFGKNGLVEVNKKDMQKIIADNRRCKAAVETLNTLELLSMKRLLLGNEQGVSSEEVLQGLEKQTKNRAVISEDIPTALESYLQSRELNKQARADMMHDTMADSFTLVLQPFVRLREGGREALAAAASKAKQVKNKGSYDFGDDVAQGISVQEQQQADQLARQRSADMLHAVYGADSDL